MGAAGLAAGASWLEAEPHNGPSHVGELQLPRIRLKPQRLLQAAPLEAGVGGAGRGRRLALLQRGQDAPGTEALRAGACTREVGRQHHL